MGRAMMKMTLKHSESGQSLVELAVSIIILLIVLAGIVDLGRLVFTKFILQDAAEEGLVYGIAYPTDCNQIVERVQANIADRIVQQDVIITVNIQRNDGSYSTCYMIPYSEVYAGKVMTISVTMDFTISMPFMGTFFGGQTVPISSTANGIVLRPPPPD